MWQVIPMDRAGIYRVRKYILDLMWIPYTELSIPPERWCPVIRASALHGGQHRELGTAVSIPNPNKAQPVLLQRAVTELCQWTACTPAALDLCISKDSFLVRGRKGPSFSLAWRCPVDCSSHSSESLLRSECIKLDHRRGSDLFPVWRREGSISCWWAGTSLGEEHVVTQMTERKVTL